MYKVILESRQDEEGYFNILIISHNGITLSEHSDNGPPEDNLFNRDYHWIKKSLEQAYKLGFEDAIGSYTSME